MKDDVDPIELARRLIQTSSKASVCPEQLTVEDLSTVQDVTEAIAEYHPAYAIERAQALVDLADAKPHVVTSDAIAAVVQRARDLLVRLRGKLN